MYYLKQFIKLVVSLALYILGPFALIALGAGMAGYGIYQDWQWLITGGIIVAALGFFWLIRHFGFD